MNGISSLRVHLRVLATRRVADVGELARCATARSPGRSTTGSSASRASCRGGSAGIAAGKSVLAFVREPRLAAPGAGLHRFGDGAVARRALVVGVEHLAEFLLELPALDGPSSRRCGASFSAGRLAAARPPWWRLHAAERGEHRLGRRRTAFAAPAPSTAACSAISRRMQLLLAAADSPAAATRTDTPAAGPRTSGTAPAPARTRRSGTTAGPSPARAPCSRACRRRWRAACAGRPCHAEVGQPQPVAFEQDEVVGLDVAVDDPLAVGVADGRQHLAGEVDAPCRTAAAGCSRSSSVIMPQALTMTK